MDMVFFCQTVNIFYPVVMYIFKIYEIKDIHWFTPFPADRFSRMGRPLLRGLSILQLKFCHFLFHLFGDGGEIINARRDIAYSI